MEIRKYFVLNGDKKTSNQNLWDADKDFIIKAKNDQVSNHLINLVGGKKDNNKTNPKKAEGRKY